MYHQEAPRSSTTQSGALRPLIRRQGTRLTSPSILLDSLLEMPASETEYHIPHHPLKHNLRTSLPALHASASCTPPGPRAPRQSFHPRPLPRHPLPPRLRSSPRRLEHLYAGAWVALGTSLRVRPGIQDERITQRYKQSKISKELRRRAMNY